MKKDASVLLLDVNRFKLLFFETFVGMVLEELDEGRGSKISSLGASLFLPLLSSRRLSFNAFNLEDFLFLLSTLSSAFRFLPLTFITNDVKLSSISTCSCLIFTFRPLMYLPGAADDVEASSLSTFLLVEDLIFLLFSLLSQLLRVETFSLLEHFSHSRDFSSVLADLLLFSCDLPVLDFLLIDFLGFELLLRLGPAEVEGFEDDEDVDKEAEEVEGSGSRTSSCIGSSAASAPGAGCSVSWLASCAT